MKFGRQAITWGNGLFYAPMDLVNPFDPATIDTEYKAGDDMLYLQYLQDNGNDLQAAVVVRRDRKLLQLVEQEFGRRALGLQPQPPGGQERPEASDADALVGAVVDQPGVDAQHVLALEVGLEFDLQIRVQTIFALDGVQPPVVEVVFQRSADLPALIVVEVGL